MSITVAPQVNEKTRQKHDYAGPAHRDSYARRTAAERTYASLADPSVGGIRRGWCRLFGRTKNTLMYALAVVVRNVRIVESFERRKAQEARARSIGPRRRRRRRHQRDPAARRSSRCPRFRPLPDSRQCSRAPRGRPQEEPAPPLFRRGHTPGAEDATVPKTTSASHPHG